MLTTIIICYQHGTVPILRACLRSIARHTDPALYNILLVSRGHDQDFDAHDTVGEHQDDGRSITCRFIDLPNAPDSGSRVHGALLDVVVPEIESDLTMTLDSDCFPVADGWLPELIGMLDDRTKCAGILHPWAPPPDDMKHALIEYRVRSQHCWNMTHVACQLLETKFLRSLAVQYNDGDDTGLLIPKAVLDAGYMVAGWKATRCPAPQGDFDAEFNRYTSLLYGDRMYHLGGYTRETVFGDQSVMERQFGWARKKVIEWSGAEFLLDDHYSYRFKFNREEEVIKEKMNRIFGLKKKQEP